MSKITLWRGAELLCEQQGIGQVQLVATCQYQPGDCIQIETDWEHALVQIDQALPQTRLFLPEKKMEYRLPLEGDNLLVYPPYAFQGDKHIITVAQAEGNDYRNLALNPADQRGAVTAYPHATANVETRDESVFCARNVIDGLRTARGHGEWPYQSWGIGARTDAVLTLSFGREVEVDAMALYLRADFPHDAYWIQGTVVLSDGYEKTFPLEGVDGVQRIELDGQHWVSWMRLERLIKCDMPSAFPALRQWEVYGKDV